MKELQNLIAAAKGIQFENSVYGVPSVPREYWHPAYIRFVDAIAAAEELTECDSRHPAFTILEEMFERNWTLSYFVWKMELSTSESQIERKALELYLLNGPSEEGIRLDDQSAHHIARAFGVSEDFFVNLQNAYLSRPRANPAEDKFPTALRLAGELANIILGNHYHETEEGGCGCALCEKARELKEALGG